MNSYNLQHLHYKAAYILAIINLKVEASNSQGYSWYLSYASESFVSKPIVPVN